MDSSNATVTFRSERATNLRVSLVKAGEGWRATHVQEVHGPDTRFSFSIKGLGVRSFSFGKPSS